MTKNKAIWIGVALVLLALLVVSPALAVGVGLVCLLVKMTIRSSRPAMAVIAVALLIAIALSPLPTLAARTGEQVLISLKFISDGVQSKGTNVLQVGELNMLSAAVSNTTVTQVVAAPASGSVYLRGILVEKSTGAAGTYTVTQGTGTNCATGSTTVLGPVTNPPIGFNRIEIAIPATKALCLSSDAATTVVRALTN
jgi:hypothetical protein